MHRVMAESYRKIGGALVEKAHLDEHCDSLAQSLDRTAKDFEAMAAAHRGLAGKK
ncbi:MAG: hypothetical protein ACREQ9_07540 [Candidatus Binatia bacterium]